MHKFLPPQVVVIGPHQYRIDSSNEAAMLLRDEHCQGDSRPDQALVRVSLDRPHTKAAETLLHELLHCVWHQGALGANGDDGDRDLEERVIAGLTTDLLDMLRENPGLVAYLTADEDSAGASALRTGSGAAVNGQEDRPVAPSDRQPACS